MGKKLIGSLLIVSLFFVLLLSTAMAHNGSWHSFSNIYIPPYQSDTNYTASQQNTRTATSVAFSCTGLTKNPVYNYTCTLYTSGGTYVVYLGGIVNSGANLSAQYPSGYGGAGQSYKLGFSSIPIEPNSANISGQWRHD